MTEKLDNLSRDILTVLEKAEPNKLRNCEIVDLLWKSYQHKYEHKKTFGIAVSQKLKLLKAQGKIIQEDIWYGTLNSKLSEALEKEKEIELTIEFPPEDEDEAEEEACLNTLAKSYKLGFIEDYIQAKKEARTIKIKGKNIDAVKEGLPKLIMEMLEKHRKPKPFWKKKITLF